MKKREEIRALGKTGVPELIEEEEILVGWLVG